MRKLLLLFLLALPALALAQDETWYRSNKSGLAIEKIPSRLAALREEYSLCIRAVSLRETPEPLHSYYNNAYSIEERILYQNGVESRCQWIYRDLRGVTRVNASFTPGYFSTPLIDLFYEDTDEDEEVDSTEEPPEESKSGFIELYNEDRFITEEHIFAQDGSESFVQFFYNNGLLVRSATWKKDPPPPAVESLDPEEPFDEISDPEFVLQIMDYYRYTRSDSLRAVERVYHTAVSEDNKRLRVSFPALNTKAIPEIEFERPHVPYDTSSIEGFEIQEGDKITYNTDTRGRVLREVRRDEEDNIIGEVENTWNGDRLVSVRITSGEEERLIEYDYDSEGDRVMERNYNNGTLERTVRSQGNRDIEELYLNGVVILRAVWESGKKISEERIRPARGNSR